MPLCGNYHKMVASSCIFYVLVWFVGIICIAPTQSARFENHHYSFNLVVELVVVGVVGRYFEEICIWVCVRKCYSHHVGFLFDIHLNLCYYDLARFSFLLNS